MPEVPRMEIPPEDPETGVGRLHCHRLTAGHRKGDHHWLRTDLAERREDHPPRHRVDRRGAECQFQAELGDGPHPLPRPQDALVAGISPAHLGRHAGAIGAVRVVPGVLHDHRTTLAVPLDGKADAPAGW
jgi:hypothetical protein